MTRHLHKDYYSTFCGKDASHILMTYEESEADCAACLKALAAFREDEKAEAELQAERDRASI